LNKICKKSLQFLVNVPVFSEVMLVVSRLHRGEEVMCNGMLSESRIDGRFQKFVNKTEVRDCTKCI